MFKLFNKSRWCGFVVAIFAFVAIAQAAFVLHEIVANHDSGTVCEICVSHAQLGDAVVSDGSLAIQFIVLACLVIATSQPGIQRRPVSVRSRSPPSL